VNEQGNIPLGGVLRVAYFLALAILLIVFITTVVTDIYTEPSGEGAYSSLTTVSGTVLDQLIASSEDQQGYDRNLGAIFSLLGGGIMAFGIAGLSRAENGLRGGIFVGGFIVHVVGLINAAEGTSDWLLSVWSFVGLVILIWAARFLENGTSWGPNTLARLRNRAAT